MTRRFVSAAVAAVLSVSAVMGVRGADAPAPKRVVVIPLLTLNVPADQQWIGKAVQETIIADLGKTTAYSPVAFAGQTIVEDNATAARIGREASASLVVRGAMQLVKNELRLTAQLIDAKTGDTVATAIATGPVANVLKLEDDLASQLQAGPVKAPVGGLAPATVAVQPVAPGTPVGVEPVTAESGVTPGVTGGPVVYAPAPEGVYPPAPYNDLSLAAQTYGYPVSYGYSYPYSCSYSYPYVSAIFPVYYPTYSYPVFSGVRIGFPSRGFHHFPAGGHFNTVPGRSFNPGPQRSFIRSGGATVSFHSSVLNVGIGRAAVGGFHGSAGFGGHAGGMRGR